MPRVTRWLVRSSLVYLVLALLAWWALAAQRAGWLPATVAAWAPAYLHLFVVGWLTQLIFGVAHWMLPMYSKTQPRGREERLWAAWAALNLGLILRVATEPLAARAPGSVWGVLLVLSAVLQWAAALLFVINTWPRVRPRRS